jgi:hypothetical protein
MATGNSAEDWSQAKPHKGVVPMTVLEFTEYFIQMAMFENEEMLDEAA